MITIFKGLWAGLKMLGRMLKGIFTWLGLLPALSALISWFGGKGFISRTIRTTLSVAVTCLAGLSGYYSGYNRGYDDAMNGRSRSWTASIHRIFEKKKS